MKILYDYSVFEFQRYGGISRYFYELITRLSTEEKVNLSLFQGLNVNEYALSEKKESFDSYYGHKWKYKKPASRYMAILFKLPNRILFDNYMRTSCADVYHPTYYRANLGKYTKPAIVLTVHDMIHELYPDQFIDSRFVIRAKKKSISAADLIICVSENTKRDLMKMYEVPEERIKVIYHGNALPKSNEYLKLADLKRNYSIEKPFLLYVGDRKTPYKNFHFLLEAYSEMFSERFDLVCFGGGKLTPNELKKIKNIKHSGKVIQLSGPDLLLASLYKNAFCFIYPSLYEGFGIPLLESMGQGCPIIASNTSSIPEVAGNAAFLFDPTSKDSLISSIELLEKNVVTRQKLIDNGFEREKEFSWEKTASETLKVYKAAYELKFGS
ncbi:glycosyltransferase family 1 protein [Methanolobus sediminis]|uniref:Glycosyltransferase family 1 protein n=1 Tax=Methanolobus sediminis TaxID=3072978 RepID=A0AA51YLA2_9EURY|nr:glycosyltransferase family 1 protein [Methanolobus sediminis]WMW24313.1 glycosyltransferase family 1 protein [Methanolobus sediminis]